MKQFTDKICIITGGASGIGRAMGEKLASSGAMVILADRDATKAEQVAAEIRQSGNRADAAALDVTAAEDVAALIERTAAEHGRLDYLFNNAGIAVAGEADEHSLDDWHQTLDVNLRGVVYGVHAAYKLMKAQGSGHIVNTASLAGLVPAANEIAYGASKHAVVGLSTTLRSEAAEFGVKVSVICPGFIDTPILYEHLTIRNPGQQAMQSREETKQFIPFHVMAVDQAAEVILTGVARNRGIITVTLHANLLWWLYRISPRFFLWLWARLTTRMRKQLAVER